MNEYLKILLQTVSVVPAAVLCFAPMKNQLRFSLQKTLIFFLCVMVPYCLAISGLALLLHTDLNLVFLLSLIVLFPCYRAAVKAELSQVIALFVGSCTWMTFPSHFAMFFDAWLYPESGSAGFSVEASIFQICVSFVMMALLAPPFWKWYSRMVDNLVFPSVWYTWLVLDVILFVYNISVIPRSYSTLYTGRMFFVYPFSEGVLLALLVIWHIIFYRITEGMLEHLKLVERARFLEVQASQYRSLKNYVDQTSRLRHDFRHSIHILSALADQGDMAGIKSHLSEYSDELGKSAPINYCRSAAINALFNYYHDMADDAKIDTDWHLQLPGHLSLPELDLAGLFGNLIENAIDGCKTLPDGERYFSLSCEIRQQNCLYIVSTNSFDGRTSKTADTYKSTKHKGQGVGLTSISAICEKYDGYVQVENDGKRFLVDIMIKIPIR